MTQIAAGINKDPSGLLGLAAILIIILMIIAVYFFMMRPIIKKAKKDKIDL